jgi:hypothetical protein
MIDSQYLLVFGVQRVEQDQFFSPLHRASAEGWVTGWLDSTTTIQVM